MVDYSRWDGVGDEEEEEEKLVSAKPVVTKFDKARSVTIPGRDVAAPGSALESVGRKTAEENVESRWKNGALCKRYYWSQDRSVVDMYFFVPGNIRGKEVRVELDVPRRHLKIVYHGNHVVVDDELCFALEEDTDGELDWNVEDDPVDGSRRVVHIVVRKKAPQGTVSWCSQILKDETPIDTSTIQGRKDKWKSASQLMKEATEIFKRNVAEDKIAIQLPPEQ